MRRAAVAALLVVAGTLTPGAAGAVALCNGLPVTLTVPPGGAEFPGTNGPDVILGTAGPDFIKAQGGDDVVCGGGGDDVILGGPGNDTLLGEDGNDKLRGAAGDDTLRGGAGSDRMLPETGTDVADGGPGSDIVDYLAAAGPVSVDLGAGIAVYSPEGGGTHSASLVAVEKVDGSRFGDTLVGDAKRNVLRGKQGADRIIGGAGDDDLIGGTDEDTIRGGAGADLVKGQAGDDDLDGGIGDDRIVGGAGSDTLVGGDGNDTLIGGLRRHEAEFTNTMDGGDGFDTCRWDFDPIADCETRRPAADLDLSMAAIPTEADPGDTAVLRLTIANRGPDGASGVTVSAALPAGLTHQSHNGPGSYAPASGAWTVGSLAAGASGTLEITVVVGTGLPITTVAEVAAASPYDPDSTPGNAAAAEDDRASVTITRAPAADLSLTKTADDPAPPNGGRVTFTLSVANAGPDPATGVAVDDALPAGLSFVSAAGDGSYSQASGIWTVGTVQPGTTASMQVTTAVASAGPLVNVAEIAASDVQDPDSTPGNGVSGEDDRAAAAIDAVPAADLSLGMVVDDPSPELGDPVTFTLTVANAGPDPTAGVAVTDVLPPGLSYESDDGAYDPSSGVWAVGSLAAGASRSLSITATTVATGTIVNRAEVTASSRYDPDSTPANGVVGEDDRVSVLVGVGESADLSLAKAVDDPAPPLGAPVAFTLTVTNHGPDPATGVEVTDLLPGDFTYLSDDGAGTYDAATGIWAIGSLGSGGSKALRIAAAVDVADAVVNSAEITASDQFDPDSTPGNGVAGEDDIASVVVDAVVDSAGPELVGFSIPAEAVDISSGSAEIAVTMRVIDDLAGVADLAAMDARFESPTGVHTVYLDFGPPVSGTDLDATFEATGTIPQFSEAGIWTLEFLYLEDDAGNQTNLFAADLAGLGFANSFEVSGPAPDEQPPELTGLSISPPDVDVDLVGRPVTVTIQVTDDLSGVLEGAKWAEFSSPSGRDTVRFDFGSPLPGGDATAAAFEATTTVPRRSEPGTWTLDFVSLADDTGNLVTLSATDVQALGPPETFATSFDVFGPDDGTPPELEGLTISPEGGVDITSKDQTVTVAIRVTDAGSGVAGEAFMFAEFSSPSGFDSAAFDFVQPPASGSDADAWFEASSIIEQGSEPGIWTLDSLYIEDDANNGRSLDAAEVAALGLPTSFAVAGPPVDRNPPTLLDLSITPLTVDPGGGPQDVTVAIQVEDDLAGVSRQGDMYVVFVDPWGFEEIELPFGKRVSGTDLNAYFEATLDDAHTLTPGTWTLAFLYLVDDALNEALFEAGDLAALGFPNSFEVVGAVGGFPF